MTSFAHRLEFVSFTIFRGFLLILPFPWAQRVGRFLGGIFYHMLPGRRRITLENLRHAFPDRRPAELKAAAKGAFENFGIAMSEFLVFSRIDRTAIMQLLNYSGNRRPFEEIAACRGLVFLSGHFGNWELAGAGSAALAGVPYLVVVRTQANRLVDRVVDALRRGFGNSTVPMERAVRESLSALREGGIVALAPDQSAPQESDYVPFFGREVATFRGPAAFALRAGVPMKMGFTVRRPDYSYDFILEDVPMDGLSGASEENVRELTRRHVSILERYIRLHPDHWLWMHRRWKHLRPQGESAGGGHGAPA